MRPAAMRAVSFCSAIPALLRKVWITVTGAIVNSGTYEGTRLPISDIGESLQSAHCGRCAIGSRRSPTSLDRPMPERSWARLARPTFPADRP
jgi:hypothetical protein